MRALRKSIRRKSYIKREKKLDTMTLSELQSVAKREGIPFGGLTKKQLYGKIKRYGKE
jgi:hypothetical protein